ncbi:sodium hydrogen exchanger 8 [Brachionus plicatilis]|uniref:Sodium/hydrogen exchanger n=1 Tax=Brachionus plicatilis TaxID=10195 RepID=A0A3M7SSU8_BRAPC|nr:sodium hydrogen exchanger 8 [Brachionus plicatilis]
MFLLRHVVIVICLVNFVYMKSDFGGNFFDDFEKFLKQGENNAENENIKVPRKNFKQSMIETETKQETSTEKSNTNSKTTNYVIPSPQASIESEKSNSWKVFFLLSVLGCSILLIHFLIQTKFHFLPESVAVIFLGAIIGLILKLLSHWKISDWSKEEAFTPTVFFLVLLPPIIFESGYNLHKGNFFQNMGSILVFAIFGTAISAFVMGLGVYVLGQINVTYALNVKESFALGSLVSAVDPVATLAIFNALDVDQVLYTLVFGESILNDAVAIVLTNTIVSLSESNHSFFYIIGSIIGEFCIMFFASALVGCLFGLFSALLFKLVDLRKTPSLETAFMLIFMYSPYVLAEAMHLSGIMSILFAGILMSHYTHFNLSPVARITVQQIFRTLSFIAETSVFAYLGLAIFSFKHIIKPSVIISSIVWCLVGRACNIFPLSILLNYFREHKITKKMQFIMWFSGLRGAIAFALSLNLPINNENRQVIITTTLILVLFTTLFLGGSTMPMMKFLNSNSRKPRKNFVSMSKTKEMDEAIELINFGEDSSSKNNDLDGEAINIQFVRNGSRLKGFEKFDKLFLKPFFIRKFTDEELRDGNSHMNRLTKQWFDESNQDAQTSRDDGPRIHFKKPIETKIDNDKFYRNVNSTVFLDSSDDNEDDILIDKTHLIK